MCDRISSVCRSAYLELRRIGSIRPFLTVEAAAELARSRILSRSNYCSSLLAGITSEQLVRLQKYKTTLPDWHSVRNEWTYHVSFEEIPLASCFTTHCLQTGNSHSAILMAHYHLTPPAVCPHTHPPGLFVLPLRNLWPSQGSIWKVLVHDLFNTRLHSFGIHYLWKSRFHPVYATTLAVWFVCL